MERKLSDFLYAADNGSIVDGKLTYDGGEITKDDTVPFLLSAMDGTDYSVPFSVVGFGMEEYCDEVGNTPMITIKSSNIIPMDRKSIIRTFRNFGRVEITDDGYVFIHVGNNGKNVAILNNTEISINNLTHYLSEFKCVIDTKDVEIGSTIFDFDTYHVRMTREAECVRIITENAQNSYVYTNIPVGKTQIAIERASDSNIYHRCAGDTIVNFLFTVGEAVRRIPCKYDESIDENRIYAVMEVTNEDNVIVTNVNTYDEECPYDIDALYYDIDTKLFGTTLPDNLYRLNHITISLGKDLFKDTSPIFVNPQYGIYYDSLHRQIYVTNVLPKSITGNTDRFILVGNVRADNDIEIKIDKCYYNREENDTVYKFTIVDNEDCEKFHFLHFSNNSVKGSCIKSTCIENSVITAYATEPSSYESYQWDIDCIPSEEPYITNVIKSGEKFPDAQDPNTVYMIRNEHLSNNDAFNLIGTGVEHNGHIEFTEDDQIFIFHNSVYCRFNKPKDATTISLITFVDTNGNILVYYKWDNDISYSYRICYIGKINYPIGSVRCGYEVLEIYHENGFVDLARDLIPFGFAPSLEGINILSILDVTVLTDYNGFEETEDGLKINSYCNYDGIYFCEPGDKLHTTIISINGTTQESTTEMIYTGDNDIWATTDPIEYFDKVPFDDISDTVYDGDLDILIDGHSPNYEIIDYNYIASLRRKDRIVYDRNNKPINYYCEQHCYGSSDDKFYLVDTNGNIRHAINTDEAYIIMKYYL